MSDTKPSSRRPRSHALRCAPFLLVAWISAANSEAADVTHQYTIIVDPELSEMRVEARFQARTSSVTARDRDAAQYLKYVDDCDNERRLRMRNRRMLLPTSGIRCLNYAVDLVAAANDERRNLSLSDENVLVSPSRWLWRPELTSGTQLRVEFQLPDGVHVAVPWPRAQGNNTYLLGESPESANAPALFGQFTSASIDVPGATLRIRLPQTEPTLDQELILDWLRATATDVTLTYGRFPNPSAQVIVIPIGESRWGSDRAVPFGRVIRDGGETIELFVNHNRPIDEFLSDWTATHEFSHLMLPYVGREQRWISEGFAQYYQNVLLARAGAYGQAEAWQKLYAGMARGRASRPELSPNEAAARGVRDARMKVYWAGAAIAMMADVALRERSDNRETLDVALERLQTCCLPSERVWRGPELFATLDTLVEEPLFVPLYRRYADTIGFPDPKDLFERLGVQESKGSVRLRDHAELARIRRAITEPEPEVAAWRQGLASN
ncbi:MAG: hypothetical protein AAF417_19075 [Pseudomonadota bacterium]